MPGAGRTHGPPATKKQAASPQVQPRHPGIPCAMVLRLIRDLPGVPGLFATVIRAMRKHLANLTPASGCQDHTISPSAIWSVVSRKRAQRNGVHRIPASRVVTIAIRPSISRRDGVANHEFRKNRKWNIFRQRTGQG
jgi:hypothetical protein